MRVDTPADQHPLAARRATTHEGRLGRGRGAVVVRGRDHIQTGQLGHERLVLVDRLERALADLRLVRRVGGVELAAQEQLVDHCRGEVAVGSGAEEADQLDPVAVGQIAQSSRQLRLGLGRGQLKAGGPERRRDVGEQIVHGIDADRREHPGAIFGRVRAIRHEVGSCGGDLSPDAASGLGDKRVVGCRVE